MEFTEEQVYKAMGLEAPAQETTQPQAEVGANGQEVADPAAAVVTELATDSGVETPAETQTQEVDPAEPVDGKEQTPQQRRENAARRRQQETQMAIDQAVRKATAEAQAKHNAELEKIFAAAGLTDAATGQPITTAEQFNAWQQNFAKQQLERELKAGNLTPDVLNQVISQHPAVQAAQQLIQQNQQQAQQAKAEQARKNIEAEIAIIAKSDPTIKSAQDVFSSPNGAAIYEKVIKKGYTLSDAWYSVNRDRIQQHNQEAARLQAQASMRSKEHLQATGSVGAGAPTVPREEMDLYRMMNPNMTDEQIQRHYAKFKANK